MDARLKDLRVLLVDDSRLILKLMPVMLGQLGIVQIDSANHAGEAEEKMANQKYDIVFLDWRMPGKTGLAFFEECKVKPAYQDIAFVFVSGGTEQDQIDKVLQAGAAEYIIKPFTAAVIEEKMAKVTAWLEKRGCLDPVRPVG